MYDALFHLFFAADVLLIVACFGSFVASITLIARSGIPHGRKVGSIAVLAGFCYLFVGAVLSLFLTSLPAHDPSVFFFPPGFAAVLAGQAALVRYGWHR